MAGAWQGRVKRLTESRQRLTRAAEGSECRVSGKSAEGEKMASNSALEGSGWHGVREGTGSKYGEAVEWTGSEPKGAEQPLLQSSYWTLEQEASNVGR